MIAMNLTTGYMRLHSLCGSEQMITKVSLGCNPVMVLLRRMKVPGAHLKGHAWQWQDDD